MEHINSDDKSQNQKIHTVDFLYLDLDVCTRCQDTDKNIDSSLQTLVDTLDSLGHTLKLNKILIETKQQAIQYRFISSPTIHINGRDIQMNAKESYCSTCSSLTAGASINCRTWDYKGKTYSAPPPALIIDAVLSNIYSTNNNHADENITTICDDDYQLPENLNNYFSNKDHLCSNVLNTVKTNQNSCCGSSSKDKKEAESCC